MTGRDIGFLLSLYNQPYVKGEIRSKESNRKMRYEKKRKHRQLLFDELILEAKTLVLSPNQKKLVRYLIDDFSSRFKELHHNASEKCIILAFMFYVKKIENSRIKLKSYRVCTKYGLTDQVFEIIVCRLLLEFMARAPIRPRDYGCDEHDVLIREGKR